MTPTNNYVCGKCQYASVQMHSSDNFQGRLLNFVSFCNNDCSIQWHKKKKKTPKITTLHRVEMT